MKKIGAIILSAMLCIGIVAGCSNGDKPDSTATNGAATEKVKIKVGASPAPHAEILEQIKDELAKEGVEMEIVEFTDYIMPNTALDEGDLDANFFQHQPYLDQFNEENGTKLASISKIHYEPMGIYAGKSNDLKNVPDKVEIAVPNDTTNEARALQLLEEAGLIKVKEGAGLKATINDIVENPKDLKISELEAAQVPNALQDVDFAVINGNYAIGANLKVSDALLLEGAESEAAKTMANVLVVREGDENRPELKKLADALKSDTVKKYMDEKYQGSVVPLF